MFDAGVVGGSLGAEGKAEQVPLVRAVPHEEGAIGATLEPGLSLPQAQRTPVPGPLWGAQHARIINK